MVDSVLKDTFTLDRSKIGFVVGDNASNVKAAFDCTNCERYIASYASEIIEEISDEDENEWEDFDDYFDSSEDSENEISSEDDETINLRIIQDELQSWLSTPLIKLPCYCHLQLILKDAMNSIPAIKDLIKNLKAVKRFFRSSPYWYDKFKMRAGKGLRHQEDTRWNSVWNVLDRVTEPKVQAALISTLNETRRTIRPCNVNFTSQDFEKMEEIAKLLEPVMELTNILQANKVTSSMVIPGISSTYKGISSINVKDVDAKPCRQSF
ncbi:unnamed protein product [Allacma fusca]|uniref:Uncharacterized protein n=1 Tax=Allacma fusca TaxID=39272 RepID=A0A8J2NZE3_9HEXA|nr:unnamed protein product [Allacma fusca]